MEKNLIAVIPARGGSRVIPHKNIIPVAGKPLIAYTIEAAIEAKEFERVIVSTDDQKISALATEYGAETVKRPKEFAEDNSPTIDCVKHLISHLAKKENYFADSLALLQPTAPLRDSADIKNALKMFRDSGKKTTVSVSEPGKSPYLSVKIENQEIEPLFGWKYHFNMRRQDLPKAFLVDGAIYITTIKNMLEHNNFFGKNPIGYVMTREHGMDIDEKIDLEIVECLIKNRQKKNG
jgi:CMP-N-acetylneuraminic acid synthetase